MKRYSPVQHQCMATAINGGSVLFGLPANGVTIVNTSVTTMLGVSDLQT